MSRDAHMHIIQNTVSAKSRSSQQYAYQQNDSLDFSADLKRDRLLIDLYSAQISIYSLDLLTTNNFTIYGDLVL